MVSQVIPMLLLLLCPFQMQSPAPFHHAVEMPVLGG